MPEIKLKRQGGGVYRYEPLNLVIYSEVIGGAELGGGKSIPRQTQWIAYVDRPDADAAAYFYSLAGVRQFIAELAGQR